MMNPPVISNSGSLEDCHTNFFALTDLCGIRWRKFVFVEPITEPLKDPILRSYAQCLRENILCVWRRISPKKVDTFPSNLFDARAQNSVTFPPLSLKTPKELWIFWYGDEPDLNALLVPELMKPTVETAEGSYENGISYECRSLLFKALHNLIERCLLSRGVMRLGKWFVQPCTRQNCSIENGYHHMSFSFGFFVHGESTVCTSIDLRNHPNVRRLTLDHVREAALNSDFNQHPVILAPYGLTGTLTGKYYKPSDPVTKKTLKEWSIFYPLLRKTEYHYPPLVEVIAGGVKMCYPAKYVLVTDIDDEDFSMSSIPKMCQQDDMNEIENENKIQTPFGVENIIGERVWQECVISSQILSTNKSDADNINETIPEKEPNFEHPTTKTVCNCTIRKNPDKPSNCGLNQSNQLMADITSAITSMGTPSSPELSPYFQYPPSVSPPEYESQALPIPSPNQLSSQYELQNFLNSSSDYDDTHSPFVLTSSEQPQNNTLTPNPSPESIIDKVNPGEQISPGEGSVKESGKSISDDEIKEKILQIKTDPDKVIGLPTTDSAAIDNNASITNALDISIKSEHLSAEMDMVLDTNQLNDSNFLNTALENIFGESEDNENETKMSFDSNEPNKKSENERKEEKNLNESSDSDSDDTDDDSDDSDDSDDDESTENSENEEEEDDVSDVEQKKHSPNKNSDGKSRKSNLTEVDNDGSGSKRNEASESLEKILSADLSADDLLERSKVSGGEMDKGIGIEMTRQSPKNSDKLGCSSIDNVEGSGSRTFDLQRTDDTGPADALSNERGMFSSTDLANDNHSNISDSDVGDFADDVDDSSNDSVKSGNSHDFVSRLTNKANDVPMKSDTANIDGQLKSELKSGNNEQMPYSTMNFLDDLNTSDTTDSNSSEKDMKCSTTFNLMRDCSAKGLNPNTPQRDHDGTLKSSPASDTKLKSVSSSSCVGLSLDSAIGSKSVEDDNAMSDLHTDNISDDEYDIKPDCITARKAENISIRNNENFESIANYISPAPISLNTLISADYSNLSDNNDTNSNDNRDSSDSKRNETSPNIGGKSESHDSLRITDKDIMEPGELLGKNLLESQDSNLTGDNATKTVGKSSFASDTSYKDKSVGGAGGSGGSGNDATNLMNVDLVKKADTFGINESNAVKGEFSSLHKIVKTEGSDATDDSKASGSKQENRNQNETTATNEIFSLPFFDEHSMQDSNQSGILADILINDPTKTKESMGQMLPTASANISIDLDSESLSHIMDSIKMPSPSEGEQKRGNSPGNSTTTENIRGDERFSKSTKPFISPAHCIDGASGSAEKHALAMEDGKSIDTSSTFGDTVRIKDNLAAIELIKSRPTDMTREIEIKIENPTEYLPEQITQSSSHDDIDVIPAALCVDKKTSASKSSGDNSSKKSKTSDADSSINKSSSSSSSRSSKSSKKSKHGKVESSKKSSKSSSKTDKSKSIDVESARSSENVTTANANPSTSSSSSKRTKGCSSRKRIMKPNKRPHRTFYSNSMQMKKRNMLNLETLASLMKTPNLSVRNHDIIAECTETAQSLYDFSTWEAWMNHPVKRFKTSERFTSRAIFKELQDLYAKQNVRLADFKNNPPNSVESKSVSDLHTSDEEVDQDYYNDSGSNSNLSDYDLNSPDILCSPTNFSDIYFGGARNLSMVPDVGVVADPECSDNSNEGSMQDWTCNLSSSATSTSRLFISSKYAPLTNIAPTQACLQQNFIYRPSWESANNSTGKSSNKKNKYANHMGNKGLATGFGKSKSKNKHRNIAGTSGISKIDNKSKRSAMGNFDYLIKMEGGGAAGSDSKGNHRSNNKSDGRPVNIKDEPISDTEVRNESESDTDSDNDKRKSGKKSHDKSNSKKLEKNQKSRKSDKDGVIDDCSLYDNNGNSDENSNDSGHNFSAIKSESYQKSNIKNEAIGNNENASQRDDVEGQPTNNNPNLDKSSSSVEEFYNEKPTKVVKVNINLDYDSEVYNEEVNIRRFHKYQRNIEMANSLQVTHFDSVPDAFPFESNASSVMLDVGQPMNYNSSSDSDSDESDSNDLDDSDNSSCDECATGPCNASILPPLQTGSTASSPDMSMSSYYNKNENYLENIAQPVQRLPETNALILNLLLYDTSLNVFRDHNFNSCSLCVCHTDSDGTFGNVRGLDSGRYLPLNSHSYSEFVPDMTLSMNPIGQFETETDHQIRMKNAHLMGYLDTDPIHCTCGYSAIVNRRLSHKSGLFYEDENEITGMAEDPQEQKIREKRSILMKNAIGGDELLMEKICGSMSQVIMDYIQEQCTCVQNSTNSVQRSIRFVSNASCYSFEDAFINVVEYFDAQDVIRLAIDNSKLESQPKLRKSNVVMKSNEHCTNVHKWPYIKASVPPNNRDVLKFMQMLMPVLQGSFNKKYMTRMWEAPYAIQGPLTWRQFHRLASTQSGQCEPQPIPSIIVGHEKEWLSVSPFAIQYWDQLMLEPYSYTRDVAYIVVTPDNDYIVDEAKQFFKELSTMYEMCKLGRHCPIKGCDGILRSSKSQPDIVNDEFEDLYMLFEDNKTIEIIKSYVQTCQQHLVPYLTNLSSDKSILDPEPEGFNIKDVYKDKSMSSPMFQPDTPEFSYSGGENKEQNSSFENECDSNASYSNAQTPTPAAQTPGEPIVLTNQNEDEIPPCIIIYVLNPLSFGHESEDLQRISCIALLRSYSKILNAVPDSIRNNIKLQILSMESILEMGQNCDLLRAADQMRCLALSIFSQCRRNLTHDVTAKVLTGFGTAANLQMVIKNKDQNNRTPYKLYAPPYILSGREETIESSEVFGASTVDTPSSVLYCNYCLSEDQKWLLAVATDERGELLETITINIEVVSTDQNPNNRADSVRRQSLQKLMDFIIGIISQTSQQWRIVIGRVGRIGHGELKAWSWLLCKSSLVKISKQLKDVCDQCSMMYLHSCPSIVSACLLTLEPDTCFRILSDQFTPDERFSQIAMQSTLSTPSDLSCTHILVLPINAAAQAVQTYPEHHITDFSEEELFNSLGNSAQGMAGINALGNINNMTSINNMNMNMNGMNSMNSINGIGGLNNINGMNMNTGMNMNNAGMNALNALNNMNNINNLAGVNNINGLSGLNGIDSINGIDNLNGIDSMDGIEGIDLNMDGMDDVNMNNIEDFLSNDWENHFTDEIQLPTDNPQDDPTLDVKLDANVNPNDDHQLLNQKVELAQVSKQDHDQKPNANLMLSVNMSGLAHQVKLESDCDTGNMQMQLHNTSDEFGQMMAQPLAIGFMVSTAPINRMPPWFWVNCPQLEHVNPVFLKSSLHIHSPLIHQNSNEYINQRFSHAGIHPLDSPYTADTMRYILESYNFLSWLAIDPNTNDRISCLPAHIQVLMQLYNMIAAFT